MVFNCEIKFDENLHGVYFSGQTLNGRVLVTTDKIKKVRGVYLKISGFALCHWTESYSHGTGKNRRYYTRSYDGREDYLDSTTYLIGSQNGNQIDLKVGCTTYNFGCALPLTLPSSFEGTYGHVRYTVSVVFDRPWKFDHTFKVAFTVLKHFDLNYDSPGLRIPSQLELTKTFCCWPCRSAPLLITASIPQSGYVPGQQINITINLTNGSSVKINEIKYSVKKIIYYHSQSPEKTKMEMVDVIEDRCPGINGRSNGKLEKKLTLPPCPPTNNNSCRVLHNMYEIFVKIKVSGTHTDPVLRIPITIGTIPLNMNLPMPVYPPQQIHQAYFGGGGFNSGMQSPGNIRFQAPGPSSGSLSYPNAPEFPETLPPSYEECTTDGKQQIGGDDQHVISQPFAPRYPLYHFDNASAPHPHN